MPACSECTWVCGRERAATHALRARRGRNESGNISLCPGGSPLCSARARLRRLCGREKKCAAADNGDQSVGDGRTLDPAAIDTKENDDGTSSANAGNASAGQSGIGGGGAPVLSAAGRKRHDNNVNGFPIPGVRFKRPPGIVRKYSERYVRADETSEWFVGPRDATRGIHSVPLPRILTAWPVSRLAADILKIASSAQHRIASRRPGVAKRFLPSNYDRLQRNFFHPGGVYSGFVTTDN